MQRVVLAGFQNTNAVYTPHAIDPRLEQGIAAGMPFTRPSEAGNYGAAVTNPLVQIGIHDGVVTYETQQPLNDPAGLLIPEDSPGRWGQLYRAGRIY